MLANAVLRLCWETVLGYQVLQYTTLEVTTGLTMVHGQSVMVKVVACISKLVMILRQFSDGRESQKGSPGHPLHSSGAHPSQGLAYSGDGVGLAVEGQLSGSWAVGGVVSDDLGDDNSASAVNVGSGSGGHEGSKGDDGELHFEVGGWY
jgi:hypothetical protein